MKNVNRILEVIARSVAVAGLSILLIQALLIVLDGILRFTVSVSIDLVRDLGPLVTAVAAACCLPVVLSEGGNIVMRPLADLRPGLVRVIDCSASAFGAVVTGVLAFQMFVYAHEKLKANEITFMLEIPKYPGYYIIAAIVSLAAVIQFSRLLELTFSSEEPR